ncbi:MAG: flavin reductase family protein [Vampirovibrio sp.]|nr:flavin reductase family protein [Vampirovibrio sp.]
MTDFINIDPATLSVKDAYKLLIGSILPRPIAFVSTISADGATNVAPFSFFNGVCTAPPTLLFTTTRRGTDGEKKDTLLNIEATGEFVVNVVTEDIVNQVNQSSAEYGRQVSEFEATGLTPAQSLKVNPPRVLESPINMECKLNQIVEIGDGNVGSGSIVIGTIVQFHYRDDVYEDGKVITNKLKPVARLAGSNYCPVREAFEVPRPTVTSV